MLEPTEVTDVQEILREFSKRLHDLSQPLTILQCRLYLGSTEVSPAKWPEAMEQCLQECDRAMETMHELQGWVGSLTQRKEEGRWDSQ